MHEAGAVEGALERVIGTWREAHHGGHIELEIRDATRAESGAVAFYAAAILADRGLDDVAVSVTTDESWCAICGAQAAPSPANPQCDTCGAPLPRLDGPAVVARELSGPPGCA
jgi:Zn finger protein HypA/HybF involved in hydrogenase expression